MKIKTKVSSKNYINSVLNELRNSSYHPPDRDHGSGYVPSFTSSNEPHLKQALLTLHFLFPHELIPALDLLDRKLVTKFQRQLPNKINAEPVIFYVQSASAMTEYASRSSTNSRFKNTWNATKVHYEVRLDAWNCTCAAFAQAQLKLLVEGDASNQGFDIAAEANRAAVIQRVMFGGVATSQDEPTPLCKHILAVALYVSAPCMFGDGVLCKNVSADEMAAWSAGWGEA